MHCGLGRMSRLLAVLALHGSGEMLYEQWIKSLECNRGVFGTIMEHVHMCQSTLHKKINTPAVANKHNLCTSTARYSIGRLDILEP